MADYLGRKVYIDDTDPLEVEVVNTGAIGVTLTTSSTEMATARGDDTTSGIKSLISADTGRIYFMLFIEEDTPATDTDFYIYLSDSTAEPIKMQTGVMWEPAVIPTNGISYQAVTPGGTGSVVCWYATTTP